MWTKNPRKLEELYRFGEKKKEEGFDFEVINHNVTSM